jgi:hypothetical protein
VVCNYPDPIERGDGYQRRHDQRVALQLRLRWGMSRAMGSAAEFAEAMARVSRRLSAAERARLHCETPLERIASDPSRETGKPDGWKGYKRERELQERAARERGSE